MIGAIRITAPLMPKNAMIPANIPSITTSLWFLLPRSPAIPACDAKGNSYLLECPGTCYSGKAVGANGLEYMFMGADLTSLCAFRQPYVGARGQLRSNARSWADLKASMPPPRPNSAGRSA
jgi:hypothetical protein